MSRPIRLAAVLILAIGLAACTRHSAPQARHANAEPDLAEMAIAKPSGKVTVPVEVRYQLTGVATKNQPATLQLAFVPQIAGTGLKVEFLRSPEVSIESGAAALTVEKAEDSGVYRRSLMVTPLAEAGGSVRAFVSMEVGGGLYFGIFEIPLHPGAAEVRK